jgi:outer membrane protein assembly factor BamB
MQRRIAAVIVMASSAGAAGPIGPLWRATIDPTEDACSFVRDLPGAVAIVQGNQLVRFDAKTGARTAFAVPAPDPKLGAPTLWPVGDTVIAHYSAGPILGLDARTGAVKWKRVPARAQAGFPAIVAVGSDLVYAEAGSKPARIDIERFDAATGTTRWRQKVTTKRAYLHGVSASARRVYVTTSDEDYGGTVVALDATGKQAWMVDEEVIQAFLTPAGDDLIVQGHGRVRAFAAATGKVSTWDTLPWSTIEDAGSTVFEKTGTKLLAHDAVTGKPVWELELPQRPFASEPEVLLGVTGGDVYLRDSDVLLQIDATTGKVVGTLGIGSAEEPTVHAGGPALTMCEGNQLVALDSSVALAEHRLKIRGRLNCTNCTKSTEVEVELGSQMWKLGTSRSLAFELAARGTLSLWVRDPYYGKAVAARQIPFDRDGVLDLGTVTVTLPTHAPE